MNGTLVTILQSFWPAPDLPANRKPFAVEAKGRARLTGWVALPIGSPQALVVICHGLGGDGRGPQVRRLAAHLLSHNFGVLVWSGRGMLDSVSLDGGTHHAGRCDDLEIVVDAARARYPQWPLAVVGISLGGHIALRHALMYPQAFPRLAVCAPLNLTEAARRLDLHPFFRRYYVRGLMQRYPVQVRTIVEFDNQVVAPANGFADAFDYYDRVSVFPHRHDFPSGVRCLVGPDDPVVPASQYDGLRGVTYQPGGHLGQGFPGPPIWPQWVVATLHELFDRPWP